MLTNPHRLAPHVGGSALTQRWLEQAQRDGQSDEHVRHDRRPRFTWYEPLEVHVLLSGDRVETFFATACDISESGIGFQCRKKIPPFTRILVCRAGELTGAQAVTARCTQTLPGYLIGAQFEFDQPQQGSRTLSKAG